MEIIEQCKSILRGHPATVVFPDCLDARVLEAAVRLKNEAIAEPVLVQSPFAVMQKLRELRLPPVTFTVVDHKSPELWKRNTDLYLTLQKEKGKTLTGAQAKEAMAGPIAAAAMMVRQGEVEVGIAGNLSSTADVLRAGLGIIPRLSGVKTISSFFLMVSPKGDKHYIFADCAVVPEPSAETLSDIAVTAARMAEKLLPEKPRVALLSFSTRGSAEHPRAEMVRQAAKIARSRASDILLDGELQFDAAVVPEVSELKAPDSVLEGNANVFIFPSLEAGNIAYKIVERLAGYTALGPFLQGFEGGWHDLSRGCSARDVFNITVAAACISRGGLKY